MAWDEIKTNMTVVGANLQLDEGCIEGSYDTGSLDIGVLAWLDINILLDWQMDPSDVGFSSVTVQMKTSPDNVAWTSYALFNPGEYYCRYIRVLVTVMGDPYHDQRPKLTQFQIQAGESDSRMAQPAVDSSLAAVPANPDLGDRHIITADGTIATCVESDSEEWRYAKPLPFMQAYDTNAGALKTYDGGSWKTDSARDRQFNSFGLGMAATGTAGQIRCGDGTNYFGTAADGEVALTGTARVTKSINISPALMTVGATPATAAIVGIFDVLQFTSVTHDDAHFTWRIPEDWDSSTDFSVYIYWAPTDGNAGNVKWQLDWIALTAENNEVLTGGVTTPTVTDATQALQDELLLTSAMAIGHASVSAEEVIGCRIHRDPGDAADTYGASASLVLIQIEYTANKLGKAT